MLWKISLSLGGIKEHKNVYGRGNKTHQTNNEARLSEEALSKQNIKASLASLSCYSSQAPTEWSTIFAFGVWHLRGTCLKIFPWRACRWTPLEAAACGSHENGNLPFLLHRVGISGSHSLKYFFSPRV